MPITCDICGKEANYKNMPEGKHWFEWMSDQSRPKECVIAIPVDDGAIACGCFDCVKKIVDDNYEEVVGASDSVAIENKPKNA